MRSCLSRAFSYVNNLTFTDPHALKIPTFRVIDEAGKVLPGAEHYTSAIDKETLHKMYRTMLEVQEFDSIFYDLQRSGRISFYMQNTGEEGLQVASAAALESDDWVYPQYRELGVFFWRGFGPQAAADQLFGNECDLGEGKQMPVHYGSRKLKIQTISSPLSTQVPQASGIGYALRLRKERNIVVCYYGEGAASEGDVHAALNFAATRHSQTLFFVRNNGFAISTPVKDQYRGDGIAVRGVGYGMPAIRLDGNDIFAVYHGTKESRKLILDTPGPVLLEALTYRRGHHSTSDDSTRYRDLEEIEYYKSTDNPILRLERYMKNYGLFDIDTNQLRKDIRQEILKAKDIATSRKFKSWEIMFTGVYDELPKNLQEQKEELKNHLEKYGDKYGVDEFSVPI
jgi:2-oxoisovalerate dehydrogenase E1 component alpha subunit